MNDITINEVLDILDKMQFFLGQRAGRELWLDKKKEIQDIDLNNFNKNIDTLRKYIESTNGLSLEFDENSFTLSLPCKIGDTLYFIDKKCATCEEDDCYGCPYNRNGDKREEKFVHEMVVEQFRIRNNNIYIVNTDAIFASDEISLNSKDFGKTIFLIKEEAEAKLVELTELGENKDGE